VRTERRRYARGRIDAAAVDRQRAAIPVDEAEAGDSTARDLDEVAGALRHAVVGGEGRAQAQSASCDTVEEPTVEGGCSGLQRAERDVAVVVVFAGDCSSAILQSQRLVQRYRPIDGDRGHDILPVYCGGLLGVLMRRSGLCVEKIHFKSSD